MNYIPIDAAIYSKITRLRRYNLYMNTSPVERNRKDVSLRLKIWFLFLLVFVPAYIAMYYWYFLFTVNYQIDVLTTDLTHYVDGLTETIDVEDFKALYEGEAAKNPNCPPPTGAPFDDEKNGYYPMDNPLFIEHIEWIRKSVALHPERGIYTYVIGPEEGYIITIGTSWYFTHPGEGFKFCQLYEAPNSYKALSGRINIWEPYNDEYGYWITTYAPIKDKNGVVIGGMGVDVPASQIVDIQNDLLRVAVIFFFATILISFVVAFSLTELISKPLSKLTELTGSVKDGTSTVDFSSVARRRSLWRDEIDIMSSSVQDMMNRLNKQTSELSQSRAEMQDLAHGVIRAQENERKYISRELHGEAGQLLAMLKTTLDDLILDLPADKDTDPSLTFDWSSFRERLTHAEKQIEETLGVVRSISHEMRPTLLDVGDVNLALQGYCKEFAQRWKIDINYEGTIIPNPPEEVAVSFYRFLQEALTNAYKHSSATKVSVRAKMDLDWIEMSVENDGYKSGADAASKGIGIAGLKERFFLLGGNVEALSIPGGFIIIARAPLSRG